MRQFHINAIDESIIERYRKASLKLMVSKDKKIRPDEIFEFAVEAFEKAVEKLEKE